MATNFNESVAYREHKRLLLERFERHYLDWLMDRAGGSLKLAARISRMDRKHLRELLRKHGLVRVGQSQPEGRLAVGT